MWKYFDHVHCVKPEQKDTITSNCKKLSALCWSVMNFALELGIHWLSLQLDVPNCIRNTPWTTKAGWGSSTHQFFLQILALKPPHLDREVKDFPARKDEEKSVSCIRNISPTVWGLSYPRIISVEIQLNYWCVLSREIPWGTYSARWIKNSEFLRKSVSVLLKGVKLKGHPYLDQSWDPQLLDKWKNDIYTTGDVDCLITFHFSDKQLIIFKNQRRSCPFSICSSMHFIAYFDFEQWWFYKMLRNFSVAHCLTGI